MDSKSRRVFYSLHHFLRTCVAHTRLRPTHRDSPRATEDPRFPPSVPPPANARSAKKVLGVGGILLSPSYLLSPCAAKGAPPPPPKAVKWRRASAGMRTRVIPPLRHSPPSTPTAARGEGGRKGTMRGVKWKSFFVPFPRANLSRARLT